jgi:hypothetical protein
MDNTIKIVSDQTKKGATQLETQSLNFLVAGFSFASAIAWMDVVRWVISALIKVNKSGGTYYVVTALATTLLSILVFAVARLVSKNVVRPEKPMFAITG